jgi:hypothetical protein
VSLAARAGLLRARLAACIAGLLLATASPAQAEWQFTPLLGYTFNGSTTLIDFGLVNNQTANDEPHIDFGGSVSLLGEGPIGIEGYFIHTPNFFESKQFNIVLPRTLGSRTYAMMGNVVLTIPRSWNRYGLRPALSGGVGLIHAGVEDQGDVLGYRLNLWGLNVGGGAVGYLSDRVGVRFDLRYFQNISGAPDEQLSALTLGEPLRLRYWTAAFGVVFKK